jgi:hypothetical protein
LLLLLEDELEELLEELPEPEALPEALDPDPHTDFISSSP